MPELHRLDIVVTEDDFPLAEALVARRVSFGWEEESLPSGESRLRVHCEDTKLLDALTDDLRALLPLADVRAGLVPEQNWMEAWRDFFTPVQAGEFLILPPWLAETDPQGRQPIFIEPKSAFGTGHHPTTTLCLEAISRLHAAGALRAGQSFLDLGTGTGILGIGCVKLGLTGLGVDIDPLAISNAVENRTLNQTGEAFEVRSGSVEVAAGRQFDVVIANILAGPLKEMAADILPLVRPGGCLILSGFLKVQLAGLEAAYAPLGPGAKLTAPSAVTDPTRSACPDAETDEWVCLAWPAVF